MHPVSVLIEGIIESAGVVETHGPGQSRALQRFGRQAVGLLVGEGLQAVLDPSQEDISGAKTSADIRGDVAILGQHVEDRHKPRLLEGRHHAAPDQLEELGKELDFPNPPGTELDIVGHALAAYFQGDLVLHLAQRFENAVVEVAAIDKGAHHGHQAAGVGVIPGHHPGLDPGITLPLASVGLVIGLHGVEAHGQRPAFTKRAQAGVHPENESVGADLAQGLDEPAGQAGEKVIIGYGLVAAAGMPALGKGENEVDIR